MTQPWTLRIDRDTVSRKLAAAEMRWPMSEPHEPARTPLWVKISGIVVIALVLVLVVLHLTGNSLGGHTP